MANHQENLNNRNLQRQLEIVPIDFDNIISTTTVFKNVKLMREYGANVIERLNVHMGLIMAGKDTGKIEVTLKKKETNEPFFNIITVANAKKIYNRNVKFQWISEGTVSIKKMNIIEFWIKSPSFRREIYPSTVQTEIRQNPIVKWLATHIDDPFGLSIVRFGQLNERRVIYDTFRLNTTEEWSEKRISECFYHFLPQSRPRKGYRCRIRGVSMIYIPKKAYCERILVNLQTHDINIMF
jgi:hypothetical protein